MIKEELQFYVVDPAMAATQFATFRGEFPESLYRPGAFRIGEVEEKEPFDGMRTYV